MYKSFFGLHALPFRANPDPRFLCMTPQIREALACLQYGIAERKGFVVMTGEVGTGKTTLLKSVLNWFPSQRVSTAFVFNPRLDVLDFLEFVLTDFGIPPKERTKSGMLLQLNQWLIGRFREHGRHTHLMIVIWAGSAVNGRVRYPVITAATRAAIQCRRANPVVFRPANPARVGSRVCPRCGMRRQNNYRFSFVQSGRNNLRQREFHRLVCLG